MTEKTNNSYDVNEYLTDGQELRAKEIGQLSVCYLFLKKPGEPKISVPFKDSVELDANERRVRLNLKALLKESEEIDSYRPLVKDLNQASSILNILVKQLEKKKSFGASNV